MKPPKRALLPALSLVLAIAMAIPPAAAQRADLPPPDAVAAALDSHPTVLAAGTRTDAARAEAEMLRKGPHEVTISSSYLRRTVDREGGFDEFDTTIARGIRLPGKARLDREAGQLGIEAASNNAEDARHQTSLMLSDLWHDWLLAGAQLRNDAQAVTNYEANLKAVRRREQLRDAAQLDVDQAQSALALAQVRLAQSRSDLERARALLSATFPALPLPQEPPVPVDPALPQLSLERLRGLVIERSHEIRAAERHAGMLDALGRRAKRDRVADPTLGVRLFSERSGAERGLGLVATMPLGGGYRSAAADKAVAQASGARLEMMNVRREVEATASSDMTSARTRLEAWQAATGAARSAVAAADRSARGYRLGATDLADLLYIQRQAIEAQRTEIDARVAALRAIWKIEIDSHTVWAPDEAGEE